ncbi:maleylpyruvate isomerase family mycothiol-dependent enzyme [Actinomycetospora sp. TBRC 11914]|uniref:maleylpyruvate isomerase family mycothiol-dependent enzyme n=1 Tax=Actinomycetospora sp. TBRC 11914 TaxID=2729387 RepID=UPI00145FC5A5|nr:maleylpyruvate isomerase family mycothiol-dependent enzyme [Actinomycetospora sp. TBRC 11914]NMO92008.1 maleylpyruvate isomerase family mycothiol-dependent enzyme [Actinomycetospora sp. TBRC 11914]
MSDADGRAPLRSVSDDLLLQATAFADAVSAPAAGDDLSAPVATCPGWTVHDLARHLGRVHRRVAATIETGAERMVDRDAEVPDGEPPQGRDEVATWLLQGASRLVATLEGADPAREVGGFVGPVTVAFWRRRQLHETLVHRLDAELAVGLPPLPDVAPGLAADGVAEWYDLITWFRAGSRRLRGEGGTVHLHCTDADDGEWLIRRGPDGVAITREHAKADVAVRGRAADLLAVVTGRAGLEGVEVFGDPALAEDWFRVSAMA